MVCLQTMMTMKMAIILLGARWPLSRGQWWAPDVTWHNDQVLSLQSQDTIRRVISPAALAYQVPDNVHYYIDTVVPHLIWHNNVFKHFGHWFILFQELSKIMIVVATPCLFVMKLLNLSLNIKRKLSALNTTSRKRHL